MLSDVEFFRIQAKHFLSDWKLANEYFPETPEYKYFDDDDVFMYFEIDNLNENEKISLGKAQHYVSQLAGFRKWKDLINASPIRLKIGRLVYENCHKNIQKLEEWKMYCHLPEVAEAFNFGEEAIYEIAKQYFENP